ncbi:MAG TPA: FliI/YscN family ATPase [Candidatus Acidoferrales bacterium]|nr:FliI/YscN family ATPase [Candidatus Acidoferrales bacterium]
MTLERFRDALEQARHHRWTGRVTQASGTLIESHGPLCEVGECCEIANFGGQLVRAEVVGFRGSTVLCMPLSDSRGIRFGDQITATGRRPSVGGGDALLGRVVDSTGAPLDHLPPARFDRRVPLERCTPPAMDRLPIKQPLGCGVRAIDAFLTCGRGQRLGIFGGSGVGKSTLIGMMARGTQADLTVVALVGERGREVREFLEDALGEEGRKRSVVVVSTSDESPLLRIRAALAATAIAEDFRARGKHVLLVLDSITRFAMAHREIGLAAGEPPTAKGYTPSVFSALAKLVERAGALNGGSITAFYTVLMEGDDLMDPVVDSVRSLLDGHLVLDRRLTSEGHYPPINILESLSRLMPAVTTREHHVKAQQLRRLLAAHQRSEDLLRIGAYRKGTDPELDRAVELLPKIHAFLRQDAGEVAAFDESVSHLLRLV